MIVAVQPSPLRAPQPTVSSAPVPKASAERLPSPRLPSSDEEPAVPYSHRSIQAVAQIDQILGAYAQTARPYRAVTYYCNKLKMELKVIGSKITTISTTDRFDLIIYRISNMPLHGSIKRTQYDEAIIPTTLQAEQQLLDATKSIVDFKKCAKRVQAVPYRN